jgi:hypothetical protein
VATLPLVPATFVGAKVEVLYFHDGHLVPIEIFAVAAGPRGLDSSMEGGIRDGPGAGQWLMQIVLFARRYIVEHQDELVRDVGLPDMKLDLERLCVTHEGQQGEGARRAVTLWVVAPTSAGVNVDHDCVTGAVLVALLALATGLQLPAGEHKTALGPGFLNPGERKVYGHDLHEWKLAGHLAKSTTISALQAEHVRRLLLPAPPKELNVAESDGEEEEEEGEDGWSEVVAKAAEVQVQAVRPPTNDIMAYLRAAFNTSASQG